MTSLRKTAFALVASLIFSAAAFSQKTQITIVLNEQFFDAALDAVFANGGPPEFPIGKGANGDGAYPATCRETLKLLREGSDIRTGVQFRDGAIYAPLAFTGSYDAPLVGCLDFAGKADTRIDLEMDAARQVLIARAHVQNVSLNGTGGVGSSIVARMVQGSVDKKVNPIDLIALDKLSFPLPMHGTKPLQMKAYTLRYEVRQGEIAIIIGYEFIPA